jgi:hypothetical protein
VVVVQVMVMVMVCCCCLNFEWSHKEVDALDPGIGVCRWLWRFLTLPSLAKTRGDFRFIRGGGVASRNSSGVSLLWPVATWELQIQEGTS